MRGEWMKRCINLLLLFSLLFSLGVTAYAEEYSSTDNWVTFRASAKMESNFKNNTVQDALSRLQPGDSASFAITLKNEHKDSTRWYMTNTVLKSLEDASRASIRDGSYSYYLSYERGDGTGLVELFNSDRVGGESSFIDSDGQLRQGLFEATDGLEDWFALDTLDSGQTGTIRLVVSLDGETQGNVYQDTLAQVKMNFAVELQASEKDPPAIVKTGDPWDLQPYYIVMAVTGLLFLLLAFEGVRQRRKEGQVKGG